MTSLIDAAPDAADALGNLRMWYYGANPATLARTPHGAHFSVVYVGTDRAYVVIYRVVPGNPERANASGFVPPEYEEAQRRELTPEEREYFEAIARGE